MMAILSLQFEIPEKKIRLTRSDILILVQFIFNCETDAFSGENDFSRMHEVREKLLRFSLTTLLKKCTRKCYGASNERATITVNEADETALLIAFIRVHMDEYMIALAEIIRAKLRGYYRGTKKARKLNGYAYRR